MKAYFVLFLLPILLLSCTTQSIELENQMNGTDTIHSSSIERYVGHLELIGSERIFQVRSLLSDEIEVKGYVSIRDNVAQFRGVIDQNGDTLAIQTIIDPKTFRVVGSTNVEKIKIRNRYFFDGRMTCYYTDKNYFYVYLDQEKPILFILDKVENVELIGGDYLRNGDKIFKSGIQIPGAIAADFHTMETFQMKSEWQRTIGMDHKHIYAGPKALTNARFDKLLEGYDSLKKIYFPDEIFIFTEN